MHTTVKDIEMNEKYGLLETFLRGKNKVTVEVNGQKVHEGKAGFNNKTLNFDTKKEPFGIRLDADEINIREVDNELIITYTDKIRIY